MLGEIFQAAGHTAYVSGNIGTPFSQTAMVSRPEDILVTEISSFQLESVDTFHAKAAAVLNVTEDHLIRHYTMDNYIAMKRRVFNHQTPEDVAVLNADDPICVKMAEGLSGRIAWFSRLRQDLPGAFVRDGNILIRWDGKETLVCPAKDVYIPGAHNLENALAASVIAFTLGVPAARHRRYAPHLPRGGAPHRIRAGAGRGPLHQRLQGHQRRFDRQGHRHHDRPDGADPGRV